MGHQVLVVLVAIHRTASMHCYVVALPIMCQYHLDPVTLGRNRYLMTHRGSRCRRNKNVAINRQNVSSFYINRPNPTQWPWSKSWSKSTPQSDWGPIKSGISSSVTGLLMMTSKIINKKVLVMHILVTNNRCYCQGDTYLVRVNWHESTW